MQENEVKQEEKVIETEAVNDTTANQEKKGFSIASMVLGIVSIVIWKFSIITGTLAIIFGVIGRKKGAKKMALAGLIMGIVSIGIRVLMLLFAIVVGSAFLTGFIF